MLDEILEYFNDELKLVFEHIDYAILSKITEIRLRQNLPVVLVIKNNSYFVDYNGDIYDYPPHNSVVVSAVNLQKMYLSLCEYSIYCNNENLKNGYITLGNGARVGIASTAVYDEEKLNSVKNIISINIRIPRQVIGCAEKILNFLYVNSFPSIIIAGKPNSGKTTLLRDLARGLSSGFDNKYRKITVVDERNEIAGKRENELTLDLGVNTDVLTSFKKSKGIEIATRTLSPEMIICDEISTDSECKSIMQGFSSGVAFALSVHINDKNDLLIKPIIKRLISSGEFDYIVLLDEYTYLFEIIDVDEVYSEINRDSNFDNIINGIRY